MKINVSKWEVAVSGFRENGVCSVSQFFSEDDVLKLQDESIRLWQTQKHRTAHNLRIGLRTNIDGQIVLDRLDPVIDLSEVFAKINENEELLRLVESLIEEPALVMKEKLIYKKPKTSGFGLHRDEPYFNSCGATGQEMVTVAVVLDDMEAASGPIRFFPTLRHSNTAPAEGEVRDVSKSELAGEACFSPILKKGDICLFDGLIPHCSEANTSDRSRRLYMITFIPKRYKCGRQLYYAHRLNEQRQERVVKFGNKFVFE